MPRNVAMKRPHPGIIRRELQHKIAIRLYQLCISSLWTHSVDRAVPFTGSFGQDPEVVAVEVHGVGGAAYIVDYQTDGAVGAKVVNVPLRLVGEGCVALVCQ